MISQFFSVFDELIVCTIHVASERLSLEEVVRTRLEKLTAQLILCYSIEQHIRWRRRNPVNLFVCHTLILKLATQRHIVFLTCSHLTLTSCLRLSMYHKLFFSFSTQQCRAVLEQSYGSSLRPIFSTSVLNML